ncbi:MAG TPA: hypothetical protein VGL59_03065 [Polyangia bacterium]
MATFGCGSSDSNVPPATGSGGSNGSGGVGSGGAASGGSVGTGGNPDGTGGSASTGTGGASDNDAGNLDAVGTPDAAADTSVQMMAPPMSAQDLCTAFCTRVTTCDTTRDLQTCTNACTNADAALFPRLRADLVAATAQCVQTKDCATIAHETALQGCVNEAAAALGPSPTATGFCDAFNTGETRCSVTVDKTDCLLKSKIYSDATLTNATACAGKGCSLIYACAAATLTTSAGSWSLGGGINPGKRCGGTAEPCSQLEFNPNSCMAAGCTPGGSCGGSSLPCNFFNNEETSCTRAGCTYTGTTCSGTPTACSTATSATACQSLEDCFWDTTCSGTVPTCSTLSVSACHAQPGCVVQDAI